jgi:hypothetical protein
LTIRTTNIKRVIKKPVSIFLILLLGFNSFGLFFFYWGEIQLCKIKADEYSDADYTPAKPLIIFSSVTSDFTLLSAREILSGGKLYDIVKTASVNGTNVYYTLSDENEDQYVQGMRDWQKTNNDERSLPGKTITLHLAKYFNLQKYCPPVFTTCKTAGTMTLESDSFLYTSPFENIISPPPDHKVS